MPEQNAPAITSILRQETHLPRLRIETQQPRQ